MAEDPIDSLPEVTPRQSLLPGNKRDVVTESINKARRIEGTLPMRFDASGRTEPVAEPITPKEAENVPPTGGLLRYSAAPFFKKNVEAAKKFADRWRTDTKRDPVDEGRLKAILDQDRFIGVGPQANKLTREAMAEAGPPTRHDLSKVQPTFTMDKPFKMTYRRDEVGSHGETMQNFPVRISLSGNREPVKIGNFQRASDQRGGTWNFETEPNILLEPKIDQPILKKAFTNWLKANKMEQYAKELEHPSEPIW